MFYIFRAKIYNDQMFTIINATDILVRIINKLYSWWYQIWLSCSFVLSISQHRKNDFESDDDTIIHKLYIIVLHIFTKQNFITKMIYSINGLFPNYHRFRLIITQISIQTTIINKYHSFFYIYWKYMKIITSKIKNVRKNEQHRWTPLTWTSRYENELQYITIFSRIRRVQHELRSNAKSLSMSNSKNDWFGLCNASLDKDFDNKIYFENNNIKPFHHAFLYHCGYRYKDSFMQKIQKN